MDRLDGLIDGFTEILYRDLGGAIILLHIAAQYVLVICIAKLFYNCGVIYKSVSAKYKKVALVLYLTM